MIGTIAFFALVALIEAGMMALIIWSTENGADGDIGFSIALFVVIGHALVITAFLVQKGVLIWE